MWPVAYGVVAQIAATCLRKAQNALLLQILKLGTRLMPLATHVKQNNLRRPTRTWLMLLAWVSILKYACS